jgi:hypothetical protein
VLESTGLRQAAIALVNRTGITGGRLV